MPHLVEPYRDTFAVRAYEVAPDGRAHLSTLCDYAQEAAGQHADRLGLGVNGLMQTHGITWMLAHLRVEVQRYPALGETVQLETWPSGHDGLYAFRDFILTDATGGPIARLATRWMTIHIARRRPIRLPPDFLDLRLPERPRSLPQPTPDPATPSGSATRARTYTVRHHDLDLNGHLNHVYPIAWIEALGVEGNPSSRLAALTVVYRAEAQRGDGVQLETWDEAERAAAFHLMTAAGRTIARARGRWMPPTPAQDSAAMSAAR